MSNIEPADNRIHRQEHDRNLRYSSQGVRVDRDRVCSRSDPSSGRREEMGIRGVDAVIAVALQRPADFGAASVAAFTTVSETPNPMVTPSRRSCPDSCGTASRPTRDHERHGGPPPTIPQGGFGRAAGSRDAGPRRRRARLLPRGGRRRLLPGRRFGTESRGRRRTK